MGVGKQEMWVRHGCMDQRSQGIALTEQTDFVEVRLGKTIEMGREA